MRVFNTTLPLKIPFHNHPGSKLHGYAQFPPGVEPTTNSPQQTPQSHERVAVILVHPYPKLGGDCENHVIDFVCQSLSNGHLLRDAGEGHGLYYPPSYVDGKLPDDLVVEVQADDGNSDNSNSSSSASNRDESGESSPSPSSSSLPPPPPRVTITSQMSGPLAMEPLPVTVLPRHSRPILVRFDMQGCGQSDGEGSWLGNAEVNNLISVFDYVCDPSKEIAASHVYIVGYSFGACVTGSFLAAMAELSRQKGSDLLAALRGVCCVGYPAGVVARFLFGGHLTRLRSGVAYLASRTARQRGGDVSTTPDAASPSLPPPVALIDSIIPTPLSQPLNPEDVEHADVLMIAADDDQFTNTSTLTWLYNTLPTQWKSIVVVEQGGHEFFAEMDVLTHYIGTYIAARHLAFLRHRDSGAKHTPGSSPSSPLTTTTTPPPSPNVKQFGAEYTDSFTQSHVWDLNLWALVPLVVFLLLRVLYMVQDHPGPLPPGMP